MSDYWRDVQLWGAAHGEYDHMRPAGVAFDPDEDDEETPRG